MTTSATSDAGITVLAVTGTVDLATAPALEEAVDAAVSDGPKTLIIDLTGVDFLASAGMAILVATQRRLGDDAAFAVVADGPATARPFRLTGLDEVIQLFATVEEARAAVS